MKLKLYNRDEIFLVNLDTVLYFKAEDHYTSVYYAKDTKQGSNNIVVFLTICISYTNNCFTL